MDSIKTFDENKDGILDEEEIKNAVLKAKNWATDSESEENNWLYYGKDVPVGPMSWKKILEIHKKYPEVFITKDKVSSSTSQKNINWLPAKLVIETVKIIN